MPNNNGRVNYLREDMQTLREKMQRGFDDILAKFDELRKEQKNNRSEFFRHCSNIG